jgi:hypothetical protein
VWQLIHDTQGCNHTLLPCIGCVVGDGFVTDAATIQQYNLSDPKPFFNELLQRPYKSRVMLGPHLYGPDNSGVPAAPAAEVLALLNSSWGRLAQEGYCNGRDCMKLPVVIGGWPCWVVLLCF